MSPSGAVRSYYYCCPNIYSRPMCYISAVIMCYQWAIGYRISVYWNMHDSLLLYLFKLVEPVVWNMVRFQNFWHVVAPPSLANHGQTIGRQPHFRPVTSSQANNLIVLKGVLAFDLLLFLWPVAALVLCLWQIYMLVEKNHKNQCKKTNQFLRSCKADYKILDC